MLKECNTTILLLQGSALFLQVFYFRRCCNSLHSSIKNSKKAALTMCYLAYLTFVALCSVWKDSQGKFCIKPLHVIMQKFPYLQ